MMASSEKHDFLDCWRRHTALFQSKSRSLHVATITLPTVSPTRLNQHTPLTDWSTDYATCSDGLCWSHLEVHLSSPALASISPSVTVGRRRRLMHDGMQYDPIQGQGHELSPRSPFIMRADKWPWNLKLGGISKAYRGPDFWFLS